MDIGNRVIIKGTDTVFDGKEGVLEEIMQDGDNTKCTVFVDFIPEEGKKVRQNFEINNIEQLNESKTINEDIGETIMEKDIKIEKLAKYLGVAEEDIKKTEYDDGVYSVYNGEQDWLVCDKDTAHNRAVEDIKSTYNELGLESFTPEFQEWVLENATDLNLEDVARDEISNCVNNSYNDEVVDECIYSGLYEEDDLYDEEGNFKENINIDDLRDELIDYEMDEIDDYKKYLVDNFGDEFVSNYIKDNANIDLDKVAEEAIKRDGIPHFISYYDGKEIDLGDGLFAYRLN